MDNNNNNNNNEHECPGGEYEYFGNSRSQGDYDRPRKRVSRETLRKRQFGALCVIALIVLILIIIMAKACTKDNPKKGGDTKPPASVSTTSGTGTASDGSLTTSATTTTVPTVSAGPNDSGFLLDKYTLYIPVGGTDYAYVTAYPNGSSEADEVWTSSDPSIATIDNRGFVTGVRDGECYVTLSTAKDLTKEVMIKVIIGTGVASTDTASGTVTGTDTGSGTGLNTATPQQNTTTAEPQQLAEAPAPPKINIEGAHYEGDVLIVNKSYPIPASYDPGGLESTTYTWFTKLSADAAKAGLNIYLSSGYRSYSYQSQIYDNYTSIYGQATADTFSARPGHSEHQTGLAIDVNTIDDSFAGTPEAIWLEEHCWEYGFILRYPKGKESITGYKYEPWHIRYVGSEVSKKVHDMNGITLEELYNLDSQYN